MPTDPHDKILSKLFEPNGYAAETAERNSSKLQSLMQLLEKPHDYLFKNGACHIYAICLKKIDSRFTLRVISGPGGLDGPHVYCKLGEFAIDVDGVHQESDLIEKWKKRLLCKLSSCEVTEAELIQPNKHKTTPVNTRGHSVHEQFVKIAIEKAEAHIGQHIPSWRILLDG